MKQIICDEMFFLTRQVCITTSLDVAPEGRAFLCNCMALMNCFVSLHCIYITVLLVEWEDKILAGEETHIPRAKNYCNLRWSKLGKHWIQMTKVLLKSTAVPLKQQNYIISVFSHSFQRNENILLHLTKYAQYPLRTEKAQKMLLSCPVFFFL